MANAQTLTDAGPHRSMQTNNYRLYKLYIYLLIYYILFINIIFIQGRPLQCRNNVINESFKYILSEISFQLTIKLSIEYQHSGNESASPVGNVEQLLNLQFVGPHYFQTRMIRDLFHAFCNTPQIVGVCMSVQQQSME